MSDPVENVEIEDVLSSIRRLVSEDTRPKFNRKTIENNDKSDVIEAPFVPEKLVLTQALRVVDDIPDPRDFSNESEMEIDATTAEAEEHSDEVTVADLETNPQGFDPEHDSIEAKETDAHSEDNQTATGDGDVTSQSQEENATHSDSVPSEDDIAQETVDDSDDEVTEMAANDEPTTLETRIAEVETAVADQNGQWEPDGEGEGDNAAQPVGTLKWEDHYEMASETDATLSSSDAGGIESGVSAQQDLEGEASKATPPSDDALRNTVSDSGTEQDADLDLFGADDAILDEESLREMVSDIVRQELQGPLGERITRNVRKLVRREIHRALASQELE